MSGLVRWLLSLLVFCTDEKSTGFFDTSFHIDLSRVFYFTDGVDFVGTNVVRKSMSERVYKSRMNDLEFQRSRLFVYPMCALKPEIM